MTTATMQHVTAAAPATIETAHGPRALASVDRGFLPSATVIERTHLVRQVMEAVMKQGTHYGTIPGTQKPTLYQPGCDVLAVTFRIATKVALVEDLSTTDGVRYRITVAGLHQTTNELLAEGIGECSSDEEKYRWRRPVCDEEFNDTPVDRRREKWAKGAGGKTYKQKQIRTSPPDVANTVLKMATKRAKVAMILNATAASDVFAQDLEDLSDELREHLAGDEGAAAPAAVPMPRTNGQAAVAGAPATSQPDEPPHPAGAAAPAAEAPIAQVYSLIVPSTPNTAFRRDNVRILNMLPRTTKAKVDTQTGVETPGRPYAVVEVSTGESFQSFHLNLNAQLETWWKAKTAIDLDCKTPREPKFMSTIEKAAAVQG